MDKKEKYRIKSKEQNPKTVLWLGTVNILQTVVWRT